MSTRTRVGLDGTVLDRERARSSALMLQGAALLLSLGASACGASSGEPVGSQREAVVGDQVRTVTIPDGVMDCSAPGIADHVAISVSAVPRKALAVGGNPDDILLGTNCRTPSGSTIYFFDPGAADAAPIPGTVTGTFVTSLATHSSDPAHPLPPNGWGATAFRGDQLTASGQPAPDLIACGNTAGDGDPHPIFRIDLGTGEATFLFNAAGGGFPCDGLAWDAWNDTIYMSPDISDTVYHYALDPGTLNWVQLGTLPVPSPDCFDDSMSPPEGNSGIEVIGSNLMLACDGSSNVVRVRESDGAEIGTPFPSGLGRAEDLECDRRTFASIDDTSVVWTKDAFTPTFSSFEVPPGTCGICRNGTTERPLLNNLDHDSLVKLARLLGEYLTATIVGFHSAGLAPWHSGFGPGTLFFSGHRGYLGGFEIWLQNVKSQTDPTVTEFVPLPKWNPGNPIPPEFFATYADVGVTAGTAAAACTGAGGSACSGLGNTAFTSTPNEDFNYHGDPNPPTGVPDLCEYASLQELQLGGSHGPGLENFHNNVHDGISGSMGPPLTSSSSVIFWPWHAWVDDEARVYECSCRNSCSTCTDVFEPPPVRALSAASNRASGLHAGTRPVSPSATAPIGYWWWFEDQAFPDDPSPKSVVDHAGYFLKANVHGAVLKNGLVGQALSFDGRDDFAVLSDVTAGNAGPEDFTVDAWIQTSSLEAQTIVSKLRAHLGYELLIDAGHLGLFLGTRGGERLLETDGPAISDGQWHHIAAVVSRGAADASALFVDGTRVLSFDATGLGDLTNDGPLLIGTTTARNERERDHHGCHHGNACHHWHCNGPHEDDDQRLDRDHDRDRSQFFDGQLDELDLIRHALSRNMVASIFLAGSAGKFGSLGNMQTSLDRPACVIGLGQQIAGAPPGAKTDALTTLYQQTVQALRAGRQRRARQLLAQLSMTAMEGLPDPSTMLLGDPAMGFHMIMLQADECAALDHLIVP